MSGWLLKLTPAHMAALAGRLSAQGSVTSLRSIVVGGEGHERDDYADRNQDPDPPGH